MLRHTFPIGSELHIIAPPVQADDLTSLSSVRAEAFKSDTAEWDTYDTYYHHLIIIDSKNDNIAAGVRLTAVAQDAIDRLYTASLFEYQPAFFEKDRWLEMGRLFIAQPYRNTRVFSYLWQGIKLFFEEGGFNRLIGSVNVWEHLNAPSRRLLIETLYQTARHPDFEQHVRAKYAYKYTPQEATGITDWKTTFRNLRLYDKSGKEVKISPALKTYLTLGAKALTIGQDPDYDHSPDVLMEINFPSDVFSKVTG